MASSEGLAHTIFQRRRANKPTCLYIAQHRLSTFRSCLLTELIPLAFYATLDILKRWESNLELACQLAFDVYRNDESNKLADDWRRYCKLLEKEDCCKLALFEGGFIFAVEDMALSAARASFIFSSYRCFHMLADLGNSHNLALSPSSIQSKRKQDEQTTTAVDYSIRHKRRRRDKQTTTTVDGATSILRQQELVTRPDEQNKYIAQMAEVANIAEVVGNLVFDGTVSSILRQQEVVTGLSKLTNTVQLHMATEKGDDFNLVIMVDWVTGNVISHIRSVAELSYIFSGLLFSGIKDSKKRQGEGDDIRTKAVTVSHGDSFEDSTIEIALCFEIGREVWNRLYPTE